MRPGGTIRGVLLLVPLWLGGVLTEASATAHPPIGSQAPTVKLGEQGPGGLVALADGTVVSWGHGTSVRMRTPKGVWSDVIPLGLDGISRVVADGDKTLVSGWKESAGRISLSVVVLLDSQGALLDRWELQGLLSVATADGKRWATATGPRPTHVSNGLDLEKEPKPVIDKLIELVSGGKVEARDLVEMDAQIASFTAGRNRALRVDCIRRSFTLEPFYSAYCVAVGSGGWRRIGHWNEPPPFSCGQYLVEPDDGASHGGAPRKRGEKPEIVVRRLDTGDVAGQKWLAAGQAVACGAPGELLIGGADVQGLSLPTLAPLWRVPVRRGRVVAVARSGDNIVAATTSGAVLALPQPRAPYTAEETSRMPSVPKERREISHDR